MSFFSSLFCFIIITQVLEYKVYSSLVDIKFILYLLINLKILCNFSLSLSFLKSSVLYQMLKDVIGCTKQMGVFFFFSLPVSDGLVGMKQCESQKYKFAARVWDSLLPDLGTVSCIRMFLVANTTQKVNSNWLNNIGARRAYIIENFRKKAALKCASMRLPAFSQSSCSVPIGFIFRLFFLMVTIWRRQPKVQPLHLMPPKGGEGLHPKALCKSPRISW